MKKVSEKELKELKRIEFKELKKKQLFIKKYQLEFERENRILEEEYLNALNELINISETDEKIDFNKMTKVADYGMIIIVKRRLDEILRGNDKETLIKDELSKINIDNRYSNLDIFNTKNKINSLIAADKQIKIFKKMVDNFLVMDIERREKNSLLKSRVITGINIVKLEKDPLKELKFNAINFYKNNQRYSFSKNIWRYNDVVYKKTSTNIANALYSGDSPRAWYRKLKKDLRKDITNADYKMFRLAQTETSFIQADITEYLYKNQKGYNAYVYIAEPTACNICKPLDGQIFKIKDLRQGINHYPMHPNCVCSSALVNYEDY